MTEKKKRGAKGPNAGSFQKGKSGNPGGRSERVGPNGETVAQLARVHTAAAIDTLVEVCTGKVYEPKDRVAAANALLDRGWGKPKESVDLDARVEGSGVPIIQIVRYADDRAD